MKSKLQDKLDYIAYQLMFMKFKLMFEDDYDIDSDIDYLIDYIFEKED